MPPATLPFKEARLLRWARAQGAGSQFLSRDAARALNMGTDEAGRKAAILADEGFLRDAGRHISGSTLWEVVPA